MFKMRKIITSLFILFVASSLLITTIVRADELEEINKQIALNQRNCFSAVYCT